MLFLNPFIYYHNEEEVGMMDLFHKVKDTDQWHNPSPSSKSWSTLEVYLRGKLYDPQEWNTRYDLECLYDFVWV